MIRRAIRLGISGLDRRYWSTSSSGRASGVCSSTTTNALSSTKNRGSLSLAAFIVLSTVSSPSPMSLFGGSGYLFSNRTIVGLRAKRSVNKVSGVM